VLKGDLPEQTSIMAYPQIPAQMAGEIRRAVAANEAYAGQFSIKGEERCLCIATADVIDWDQASAPATDDADSIDEDGGRVGNVAAEVRCR
jgi:hypothetical protein